MAEVAKRERNMTAFSRVKKFLREVRTELRKVAWPNRKELITYTIVVLVSVLVVSVYIYGVDVIVSGILRMLERLGG